MTLTPGSRLGPYEIVALLGAGGMGEVYRGHDTKLNREVAIKVLPESVSRDEERMTRFEREARLLASLNHAHIGGIYGLEESGGLQALILELIEGPTLADRLAQGPIPIEEALPIAKQIADALEYAHVHGVIHRDLKPANVKLSVEGNVKVLDFGLAKALKDETPSGPDPVLSLSPTRTQQGTAAGVILGTATYMSPEQARGRPVDKRADIWAFGLVLYEMLTGKRPFSGEAASEILASVIKDEPEWSRLPVTTPNSIRQLLRRCLTKDAKQRLRDIGDARLEIEEVIAGGSVGTQSASGISLPPLGYRVLPWAVASAALAVAGLVLWAPWTPAPRPQSSLRLSVDLGTDASLRTLAGAAAIVSPDGTTLAFVAQKRIGEAQQIYVRRLDQLQAAPLADTAGARNPFFSPDGQWIAFFAGGKLKKVPLGGGAVVTLCEASNDRGGTWAEGGTIVFAPDGRSGLSKISSAGGTPEPLTTLDTGRGELTHRWPQALPGGRAVLFASHSTIAFDDAGIFAHSLVSRETKLIHQGGYYAACLPSGHLVYLHRGTLFAAPFDLDRLEMTAPPLPVLEGVMSNSRNGGAQLAYSRNGVAVYVPGMNLGRDQSISWMDPEGRTQVLRSVPANYSHLRFSPDGRKLAAHVSDNTQSDVWVYEWQRGLVLRLTFDPGQDEDPEWTADGSRIAFASRQTHTRIQNIFWKRADGTGDVQRLTGGANPQYANSWHPGGKFLAFEEQDPQTDWNILILPLDGNETSGWKPGKPTIFVNSPSVERYAAFSPDGNWLAYQSNESGRFEVYVRPFPGPGGRWQITWTGGGYPTWSRNGKELFYRALDQRIMVCGYSVASDSFRAENPRVWSEGQFDERIETRTFDLHPDGKRVAVVKATEAPGDSRADRVVLILNFFDELRRMAPGPRK